ncbi:peptidyl-tRNA hydrolase [Paeniglutamicibacter quisquiliarum]|uniref:peptidyl-tRNA hydrolase n=1 Tax=Paeniglutamicibacter quisquiliarum TaxID=2849498 RepID=UPI00300C253B
MESTLNEPSPRPEAPENPEAEFPEPTGELVQPIILLVDREEPCPEDEGIAVAALASVGALLANPRHPYWRPWAQGAFAKSVRRADAKMFAKVAGEFPGHTLAQIGTARAMGFAPMQADSLPKRLAKLQVSGTTLPPGSPMDPTAVRITLNDSLGMSTGKAAAQAAHALFAWVLEGNPQDLDTWRAAGCPLSIERLDSKAFRKNARSASGPVIHDAGRTEITPGSATAFVNVG